MRAFELFEEREIPDTPYGYWIDPKGNFHVVPFQAHEIVIQRLMPNWKLDDALEHGWIRVVSTSTGLIVDIWLGKPKARALSALRDLAKHGQFQRFEVEVAGIPAVNDTDFPYWKKFEGPTAFIGYVQRASQFRPDLTELELMEAPFELPETRYGYWIKDDGSILVVPTFQHGPVAASNGAPGKRLDNGKILNSYSDALNQGWIRLVSSEQQGTLSIEFQHHAPTIKAFLTLKKIATTGLFDFFNVESNETPGSRQQYSFTKSFRSPAMMLSYVSEMRRPKAEPQPDQPQPVAEEVLEEAEVPPTNYGYWIDPKGGIHAVSYQRHFHWLQDHTEFDGYMSAFVEGWIRVISHGSDDVPTLSVNLLRGRISSRALSALARVAGSDEFYNFRLDIMTATKVETKSFNSQGSFMAVARAAGRMVNDDDVSRE